MGNRIGMAFSKIFCAACAICLEIMIYSLVATKLLPTKYVMILGGIFAVLIILCIVLTWAPRNHGVRYVLGLFLTALLMLIMLFVSKYAMQTKSSVSYITSNYPQTTEVGIYVLSSNTDDFDSVAVNYNYGILDELDRDNTDKALTQFNSQYGAELKTTECSGLPSLADALTNGEVDAIIINDAYIDILDDMDGYEGYSETIVRVAGVSIEDEYSPGTTVTTEDGTVVAAPTIDPESTTFTCLISGVDTRGALTAKSRSDVNILAAVNTETHQVALISTPRDYFVPLSISNGNRDKLTHAGIYGVQVCMDTIGMLYDTDVNYYLRMNFVGFKDIINALGGVSVYSDYDFDTKNVKGYHFNEGYNDVDGAAALAFVRERYAFAAGDRQRGKNQLHVISAVIDKLTSPELLMNYTSVLAAAEGSFETSVPYDTISYLVQDQLESGEKWNIVSYSVTGSDGKEIPYSMSQYAYVMIPDESTVETAQQLIQDVLDGKTVSSPAN